MVNRAIFSPTVNRFPIRASMRVSIRRRIASNTRVVCFSGPPLDGPGSPNSDNATPPSTPSQPNSPVQLRLGHVPKLALPLAYLAARLAWKPNLLPELGDAASILLAYGSKQVLELSQKFDLQTASELQDLVNCLVLSECVYKCVGRPEEEAFLAMSELKSRFPPGLVTIRHAQFSNTHTAHRFMLAESGEAFYVALMGTKYRKDYFTNVQAFDEMFPALESQGGESSVYAHRGYLQRANSVPVAALNKEAQHRGKRLVFCGHSLGGAVAALCTIRLLCVLKNSNPNLHSDVSCYGFATPAIGNQAFAKLVTEHPNWAERIRNYLVPEDPIPHLLTLPTHEGLHPGVTASGSPTRLLKSRTGRYVPIGRQIFVPEEQQQNLVSQGNEYRRIDLNRQQTIFPMHRMFTYRTRILQSCKSLIPHHQNNQAFSAILQDFQLDVQPTQSLAPRLVPLRAVVIETTNSSSTQPSNASSSLDTNSIPQKWISKLPKFGRSQTSPVSSRMCIQVEGGGLDMVGSAWLATPKRVFVALANIFKADTVPDVRLIHVSRKSDGLEREDSRSGAFDWMLKRIGAASDAETDGAFATERLILIADVERNAFDGPVFVYLQSPFDVQSLPLRLCE